MRGVYLSTDGVMRRYGKVTDARDPGLGVERLVESHGRRACHDTGLMCIRVLKKKNFHGKRVGFVNYKEKTRVRRQYH